MFKWLSGWSRAARSHQLELELAKELVRTAALTRERDDLASRLALLERKHDRLLAQALVRDGGMIQPLHDPVQQPASPLAGIARNFQTTEFHRAPSSSEAPVRDS